jgi:hypothetical protein
MFLFEYLLKLNTKWRFYHEIEKNVFQFSFAYFSYKR